MSGSAENLGRGRRRRRRVFAAPLGLCLARSPAGPGLEGVRFRVQPPDTQAGCHKRPEGSSKTARRQARPFHRSEFRLDGSRGRGMCSPLNDRPRSRHPMARVRPLATRRCVLLRVIMCGAVASQRLKPIAWQEPQIVKRCRCIQNLRTFPRLALKAVESPHELATREGFCMPVVKTWMVALRHCCPVHIVRPNSSSWGSGSRSSGVGGSMR